jgi:hypothetical protein
LTDPFPVRANGTRFDTSTNGQLGVNTLARRGYTFDDYQTERARQFRWRLGAQHQLGRNTVLSATYSGSYSDHVYVMTNYVPVCLYCIFQPIPNRFVQCLPKGFRLLQNRFPLCN